MGTLLFWVAAFLTIIVTYLLMNWLPTLLIAKGFNPAASFKATAILGVGQAIGNLATGLVLDRGHRLKTIVVAYGGTAVALTALAYASAPGFVLPLVFTLGAFPVAAQLLVWAMAMEYYPRLVRGTGLGALVCVGRVGSVVGPLAAGILLSNGKSASGVLLNTVPGVLLAMLMAISIAMYLGRGPTRRVKAAGT
jgi:AAHS family 3-hydroxyphenylpropionic acid transporter